MDCNFAGIVCIAERRNRWLEPIPDDYWQIPLDHLRLQKKNSKNIIHNVINKPRKTNLAAKKGNTSNKLKSMAHCQICTYLSSFLHSHSLPQQSIWAASLDSIKFGHLSIHNNKIKDNLYRNELRHFRISKILLTLTTVVFGVWFQNNLYSEGTLYFPPAAFVDYK